MLVCVNKAASLASRVGPARGRLAGAVGDRGPDHRHPGAVDSDVELVGQHRRWQRADAAARDRFRLGGGAVGFGATFDPLGVQPDSGQFSQQASGLSRDGCGAVNPCGDPMDGRSVITRYAAERTHPENGHGRETKSGGH